MPFFVKLTPVNKFLNSLIVLDYMETNLGNKKLTVKEAQEFGPGLLRWIESGEISLSDMLEGGVANSLVTTLLHSPLTMDLNSDFNGMSKEELDGYINLHAPFWDRVDHEGTGVDMPIWVGCPGRGGVPQIRLRIIDKFFAISINEQRIIPGLNTKSGDEVSACSKISILLFLQLRMWIRLNRQALLEYWEQKIDTPTLFAKIMRLPKYILDISTVNLQEHRIFPVEEYKLQIYSTDIVPQLHISSTEEGYRISLSIYSGELLYVDMYGKRDTNDTLSDVVMKAKEWLEQKPAHPQITSPTNRANLMFVREQYELE